MNKLVGLLSLPSCWTSNSPAPRAIPVNRERRGCIGFTRAATLSVRRQAEQRRKVDVAHGFSPTQLDLELEMLRHGHGCNKGWCVRHDEETSVAQAECARHDQTCRTECRQCAVIEGLRADESCRANTCTIHMKCVVCPNRISMHMPAFWTHSVVRVVLRTSPDVGHDEK